MKVTVDVECTPAEARAFLGLPDVAPLNEHLVEEMRRRMDENLTAMRPEELMKNWFSMGGQATEQFRKMMMAATGGSAT
jgi:hypothetical protein